MAKNKVEKYGLRPLLVESAWTKNWPEGITKRELVETLEESLEDVARNVNAPLNYYE